MANLWIKDQDGNPSVVVTLVLVSFIVTTISYVLSTIDHIGVLSIRPFDVSASSSYFGVVMGAFVGHKWVTSKFNGPEAKANAAATVASGTSSTADNTTINVKVPQ